MAFLEQFGATRRAAVLFRPDFVARSSQIHCGICSSLAPRLGEKSLAANAIVFMPQTTKVADSGRDSSRTAEACFSSSPGAGRGARILYQQAIPPRPGALRGRGQPALRRSAARSGAADYTR